MHRVVRDLLLLRGYLLSVLSIQRKTEYWICRSRNWTWAEMYPSTHRCGFHSTRVNPQSLSWIVQGSLANPGGSCKLCVISPWFRFPTRVPTCGRATVSLCVARQVPISYLFHGTATGELSGSVSPLHFSKLTPLHVRFMGSGTQSLEMDRRVPFCAVPEDLSSMLLIAL